MPIVEPIVTPVDKVIAGDWSTSTIKDYIVDRAILAQVDPALALAVAEAESGLDWAAHNQNSTASGLFQFINQTWLDNCGHDLSWKDNPIMQTECALTLIKNGGIGHWKESEYVWSKLLQSKDWCAKMITVEPKLCSRASIVNYYSSS